jgi:Tol biopolymer transport system component
MKKRQRRMGLAAGVIVALCGGLVVASGQQRAATPPQVGADALLGAAQYQEQIEGKLDAAIESYRKVLAAPDATREQKARAQFRIGACYERLGVDEARKAYEAVVANYSDQAGFAAEARARLAALAGAPSQNAGPEMTMRRVWSGAGVDVSGSPSPDGKYLSIMDPESGDLAIWDIANSEKRRLTNKGNWATSEMVLGSTWSPDGKKIAYAWLNKDVVPELRIIGSDGSEPRLLPSAVWPRDWSPDGRFLLGVVPRDNNTTTELALASLADGSVTTLGTADKPISSWDAGYSADGKYIVYDVPQQEGSSEHDIFMIALDGKRVSPLVTHPANDQLLGWVPGSDVVLFTSDRTGTQDAWAIHVADGKPLGEPVLVRRNIGKTSPMGFADRGSFYYSAGGGIVDVFEGSLDLAKGTVAAPPQKITQRVVGRSYSEGWSPDGKYLAWVSERQTGSASRSPYILCIRSEQTGEQREVPLPIESFWTMHWSADSGAVFATVDDKTNQGLFKIDIRTGTPTLLARSGRDSLIKSFAVSPDGKSVYYAHLQWTKQLVTYIRYDLETGQEKEVYRKAAPPDIGGWTISPDGKYLSFPWGNGIRMVPTSGGEARDLLLGGILELPAGLAWTPDGKTILMVTRTAGAKGEKSELWQVPSAGGTPTKIDVGMDLRDVQLHPDGRRFAFKSGTDSKEVWVMENFLPAPKGVK